MLEITTLGGLRIKQGGKPVERLASRKATALLVYLACTRQPLGRPLAANMLWPASGREHALRNLGVAVRQLRKHLRGDLILNAEGLALNSEAAVWLDVHALQAHLAAGRTVSAVELYGGSFLDGFPTRDIPAFGQWVAGERQRLHGPAVRTEHGRDAAHRCLTGLTRGRRRRRRGLRRPPQFR